VTRQPLGRLGLGVIRAMPIRLQNLPSGRLRVVVLVLTVVLAAAGSALTLGRTAAATPGVSMWLSLQDAMPTDGNFDSLRRPGLVWTADAATAVPTIDVHDGIRSQPIEGFGASLTDSSAWLISRSPQRDAIMQRLFSRTNGIGVSFLRQPMGGSDYTAGPAYTYDDAPIDQPDTSLSRFSVGHDDAYIIPLLRQALTINPAIKIIAAPWSPPAWMKQPAKPGQSPSLAGGSLSPAYYAVYAQYFKRFLDAYRTRGIPVFAISMQNEPTVNLADAPWASIPAAEEQVFLRDYLGPALAGSGTRILVSDDAMPHMAEYVQRFKADPSSWQYVGGTALHCYFGGLDHLVVDQQPAYLTECSNGIAGTVYDGNNIDAVIDGTRAGARAVALWNFVLDQNNGPIPAAPYGCNFSDRTWGVCTPMITMSNPAAANYQPTAALHYDPDFYYLGHASKFVVPGAVRVDSTDLSSTGINDVAFRNPDGTDVLIVHNKGLKAASLQVRWGGRAFRIEMPARSAATFTWKAGNSG
jgi:glucosylceramidase